MPPECAIKNYLSTIDPDLPVLFYYASFKELIGTVFESAVLLEFAVAEGVLRDQNVPVFRLPARHALAKIGKAADDIVSILYVN